MNKLYFEYYVPSIPMYNTGVCQTDGRTDGHTDGQTSCHGIIRAMHTRRAV